MERVNIKIGPLSFDHADYDADNDCCICMSASRRRARGTRRQRATSSATHLELVGSWG
jgi:hypothetical protein